MSSLVLGCFRTCFHATRLLKHASQMLGISGKGVCLYLEKLNYKSNLFLTSFKAFRYKPNPFTCQRTNNSNNANTVIIELAHLPLPTSGFAPGDLHRTPSQQLRKMSCVRGQRIYNFISSFFLQKCVYCRSLGAIKLKLTGPYRTEGHIFC